MNTMKNTAFIISIGLLFLFPLPEFLLDEYCYYGASLIFSIDLSQYYNKRVKNIASHNDDII
jgi:hypothetical protein